MICKRSRKTSGEKVNNSNKSGKRKISIGDIITNVFLWSFGLMLVVLFISYEIVPAVKWVYTDMFKYTTTVYARSTDTGWKTEDARACIFAFRRDGNMRYHLKSISIGENVVEMDLDDLIPNKEVSAKDRGTGATWYVLLPEDATISPYGRIIITNVAVAVVIISIIIAIVVHKRRKR